MKKKQKTTAEVQAAIFRREHRKSPLRGGVKLTLKKARELALQEFGTAKGIQQEVNHFRTEYEGGMFWDWSLKNPYSS